MRKTKSRFAAFAVAAAVVFTAACASLPKPLPPAPPLQAASLQELVAGFNRNADAVQTMQLQLKFTAHEPGKKYTLSGYLLMQKPADLRIWGSVVLVGKIFDMASNGSQFELSIPPKSKFYEGDNNVIPEHVANPLDKMRPQVILNALLTHPINSDQHTALDRGAANNVYELLVLAPGTDNTDRLVRKITISRVDLLPSQEEIFDPDGIHFTRARYSHYVIRQNISVPTLITIERPIEAYSLTLHVTPASIVLNRPFTVPNTFQLPPPAGYAVIRLGPDGAPPPTPQNHRGLIH